MVEKYGKQFVDYKAWLDPIFPLLLKCTLIYQIKQFPLKPLYYVMAVFNPGIRGVHHKM